MSAPVSAFARYAQETSSSPETNSVLPASRKRKRASMNHVNNGHVQGPVQGTQTKKNRSKSLMPLLPIAQNNGQLQTTQKSVAPPSTNKKAKPMEKKFLSPAYPTPFPQRRVIVSESRLSSTEENDREEEQEEEVRDKFLGPAEEKSH